MELYPENLGNVNMARSGSPEETCYGFSFALFHTMFLLSIWHTEPIYIFQRFDATADSISSCINKFLGRRLSDR